MELLTSRSKRDLFSAVAEAGLHNFKVLQEDKQKLFLSVLGLSTMLDSWYEAFVVLNRVLFLYFGLKIDCSRSVVVDLDASSPKSFSSHNQCRSSQITHFTIRQHLEVVIQKLLGM